MVAVVLANARQGMLDLDAITLKQFGLAYPGKFEQLRGLHRARRDYHGALRVGLKFLAVGIINDAKDAPAINN